MPLRRPPLVLPSWWFDERADYVRVALQRLNEAPDPDGLVQAFPSLEGAGEIWPSVIQLRPWDGYVSLVEILQLPGVTPNALSTMLLDTVGQGEFEGQPVEAIVTVRSQLYRDAEGGVPWLKESELTSLLMWSQAEHYRILRFINHAQPHEFIRAREFEELDPDLLPQFLSQRPYATMVEAAGSWPLGVDHLRKLSTAFVPWVWEPEIHTLPPPQTEPPPWTIDLIPPPPPHDLPPETEYEFPPWWAGGLFYTDGTLPLLLLPVRLEVRYLEGGQLGIRVYPDDIHMADHRKGLIQTDGLDEAQLGTDFWQVCIDASFDETACRAAWEGLCDPVGPHRATHIVRSTKPHNLSTLVANPAAVPAWPIIGRAADDIVRLFGMPGYWVFKLTLRTGKVIWQRGLAVDQSLEAGVVDPVAPEPRQRWLVDFPAAVTAGMAVVVNSAPFDTEGLESIHVFGVHTSLTGEDFMTHMEQKSYSSGVSFAPDGAATNNTPGAPAFFTADLAREARWGEVWRLVHPPVGANARSAHALFARALGVPAWADRMSELPGADDPRDDLAKQVQTWTYPTTFEPALEFAVGPGAISVATMTWLSAWQADWIRPNGPFSTLRVGAQPYGVLPFLHPVAAGSTFPTSQVLLVTRRMGLEYDAVLPQYNPTTPEVATLSRTAHPSMWSYQDYTGAAALHDAGVKVQNEVAAIIPDSTGFPDPAIYSETFQPVKDYLLELATWAINQSGPQPVDKPRLSVIVTLTPDPDAQRRTLRREASGLVRQMRDLCRPKAKHVPVSWTTMKGWFTADGMIERRAGLGQANFRPAIALNQNQRDLNRQEAEQKLDALEAKALTYRSLNTWTRKQAELSRLLRFARSKILQVADTAVADLMDRLWPPNGPVGEVLVSDPDGVPTAPDGIPLTGEYGWWLDVPEQADLVPGWWTRSPPDRPGDLLADLVLGTLGLDPGTVYGTWGEDRFQWALRASVGGFGTRPDVWHTAASWEAVEVLRRMQDDGDLAEGSVLVGGYGFSFDLPGRDQVPQRDSEGYMLAPSPAHAATASVLRSGWLARDPTDEAQPLAVKLEGRRTQTAVGMLRAIGEGHDPGPWLGRRIEESLVEVDPTQLGPLRLKVMGTDTTPLDGFAALEAYRAHQDVVNENSEIGEPDRLADAAADVLAGIANEVDAIHDLMHAEGVHQLLQRRPERAQVILDALNLQSPAVPRQWDMIRPPETGQSERFALVAVQWPSSSATSKRAQIAPYLDAWCERYLEPASLTIEVDNVVYTLADLNLSPLDAVLEGAAGLPLVLRTQAGVLADPVPTLSAINEHLWRQVAREVRRLLPQLSATDPSPDTLNVELKDRAVVQIGSWLAAHSGLTDPLARLTVELDYRTEVAPLLALVRQGAPDDPRVGSYLQDLDRRIAQATGFAAPTTTDEAIQQLQLLVGTELPIGIPSGYPNWPVVAAPDYANLHDFAKVRPAVEKAVLAGWAAEAWSAVDEVTAPFVEQENGRAFVIGPSPLPLPGKQSARWEIDAWEELRPGDTTTLGVAMHVDAPAAQAPASLILAVPPPVDTSGAIPPSEGIPVDPEDPPLVSNVLGPLTSAWTVRSLAYLLDDLVSWMKRRGVGSDELAQSDVLNVQKGVLPATFKPGP